MASLAIPAPRTAVERSRLRGATRPGFTDGKHRRDRACGQEGTGDPTVRPNDDSHAGNAPLLVRPNIAGWAGVRKGLHPAAHAPMAASAPTAHADSSAETR